MTPNKALVDSRELQRYRWTLIDPVVSNGHFE